jgi:hypothetical protein
MGVMILGMSTANFTMLHVVLALVGMVSGAIVLLGMLTAKHLQGLAAIFLASTILTSVTGFFFQSPSSSPARIVGIISLLLLAAALFALYACHLAGAWRWIYVATAVTAFYLNAFVGVVQAFQKLPALQGLAPTQSEPPFLIAQFVVLAIFLVLGVAAVKAFHPKDIARV